MTKTKIFEIDKRLPASRAAMFDALQKHNAAPVKLWLQTAFGVPHLPAYRGDDTTLAAAIRKQFDV